jgi:uncharacterized membrane protein YkoI
MQGAEMNARWTILAAAGATCLVTAAATARADEIANDALQVRQANISLSDAVAIAEAKASGRASKAEFEKAANGWIFDVEIVAEDAVKDVHVSAETGNILSVTDDEIDTDDADDSAD